MHGLALLAFDLSVSMARGDGLFAEALRSLAADPHWGVNSLLDLSGSRSLGSRPNGLAIDGRSSIPSALASRPSLAPVSTIFGSPLSDPRRTSNPVRVLVSLMQRTSKCNVGKRGNVWGIVNHRRTYRSIPVMDSLQTPKNFPAIPGSLSLAPGVPVSSTRETPGPCSSTASFTSACQIFFLITTIRKCGKIFIIIKLKLGSNRIRPIGIGLLLRATAPACG